MSIFLLRKDDKVKKVLSCIGKYKIYAILTPVFVMLEVIGEVAIPMLMSKIVDEGIDKGNMDVVIQTGIIMAIIAIFSLIFGILSGKTAVKASTGLSEGIRQKEMEKIQEFSSANIDKYSTASLVTRLTTDITYVQMAFQVSIRMSVRAPFMLICSTVMAFTLNSSLAMMFLAAIPILGSLLFVIAKTAYPKFTFMLHKYDEMEATIQENLIAIRTVKAYVRKDYESKKFNATSDAVNDASLRAEKILLFNNPVMQFVMYACMLLAAWFGAQLVISTTMTTGELMSFINYIQQILFSLMMISMAGVMIVMSASSFKRIGEVLNEEPDIKDSLTDQVMEDASIEFDHVGFSYSKDPHKLVLNDINLKIHSGETIGIIGGTGSAKTTLVQLIPRLYDTTLGEVRVGGHNVKEYKIDTLRNQVAMVLQKNVLFSGTIKENLKWGNEEATDEEIIEACKAAQAHDFIMSFPAQYETELGQGGVNVSGGQKQRLCIARALLKKPKIIILDDSTSAVDTATDSKIRAAFKANLKHTTTLIIAQRIASVQDADRILVLDKGNIVAIGQHEELLQTCPIYQEVYVSQQKGVIEQ